MIGLLERQLKLRMDRGKGGEGRYNEGEFAFFSTIVHALLDPDKDFPLLEVLPKFRDFREFYGN